MQLSQLHRFTDPAEARASLALRDGDPRALAFYFDHRRVHVGDLAKATNDAFAAWVADRAAGLDAIMLAPTRELVADLNRRARDHRLGGASPGQEVELSDRSQASVGDVIITRTNDRRLRLSATDWVKNGDRWTITHVAKQGGLRVRHTRSHRTVRLPADYVRESTGLGYASTIHSAQGSTADAMHGLLTGQESRQQLYTMLTRGGHANHLYLQTVGDGDPHTVVRPDTISPRTPTETLQQIIARDEAPVSASTLLRELSDPAARLHDAVQRYTDALHLAAERAIGPQAVADLDHIDQHIPGLTAEPAWPTLRTHLIALAAETGDHPYRHVQEAANGGDLFTAGDMAAVLDWRLLALANQDDGPLPWIPGVPTKLQDDPAWGSYLSRRSLLVANLADLIKSETALADTNPSWAPPDSRLSDNLLSEVAVWRAANGIDPSDLRPTGGPQLETEPSRWQNQLDRAIAHFLGSPRTLALDQPRATYKPFSRHHRHQVVNQSARPPAPSR